MAYLLDTPVLTALIRDPAGPLVRRIASVGERHRNRLARFELVAHVADDLREQVFECEESGGAAELVHDERLMSAAST